MVNNDIRMAQISRKFFKSPWEGGNYSPSSKRRRLGSKLHVLALKNRWGRDEQRIFIMRDQLLNLVCAKIKKELAHAVERVDSAPPPPPYTSFASCDPGISKMCLCGPLHKSGMLRGPLYHRLIFCKYV